MNTIRLYILLLFFVAPAIAQLPTEVEYEISLETQKFRDLLEMTYKYYVDSINIHNLSEKAFSLMLKELDPYSNYYGSDQYRKISEANVGKSAGVGINIIELNDTLTVISVSPNSPADSAGLLPGDKLLFIDGENALKYNTSEGNLKLSGAVGSKLSLIVFRKGSLKEYVLKRSEVPLPCINSYFIINDTDVGFIKSNRFSLLSDVEFKSVLNELKDKGMRSLIVDLRGNQGGYIDQVCNIIDEFLEGGNIITYTKARHEDFSITKRTTGKGDYEKLPIVLIIDKNTASAAEIFAGAIQDFDRGIIIGEQSLGKGLVQKAWNFKDGSAFHLTVARYFTPSGRLIQKPFLRENEKPVLDEASKLNLDQKSQEQIEEAIRRTGGRTFADIHKTRKGRSVIGGGGIYPDYFIQEDTTTLLVNYMKTKGIFVQYAYSYLEDNRSELKIIYGDNISKFVRDFKVTDEMMTTCTSISKSRKIWNEKMYETDKEYIRNFIKSAIAHALWGDKGFYQVSFSTDNIARKALEYIEEAKKMIE